MSKLPRFLRSLAVLLLVSACDTNERVSGNAINGEKLFTGSVSVANGRTLDCVSCHAVTPDEAPSIGTNVSNIGNRAATTVPGQSAEQYLHTAIVEPDGYLAGGFQEGIHPRTYGKELTDEQINDLIAYMLTLRSGQD